MRVRLTLKNQYPSSFKDGVVFSYNKTGWIQTSFYLQIGDKMKFEDFQPISLPGDLNVEHYKHFHGRVFKRVPSTNPNVPFDFIEV